MPKTNARNRDWELPEDAGERLGVNHNNVGMVTVALLLDIREELRGLNKPTPPAAVNHDLRDASPVFRPPPPKKR